MLFLITLITGVGGYFFYLFFHWHQRQRELAQVVEKRRRERELSRDAAATSANFVDPQKRKLISSWDFQQLKEHLQNGTVSCVDVLRTYFGKAVQAHEATNCVVMFIREAEEWALAWDEKAKDANFVKPSFFGIPVSLKECVPLEGYDQTRGFVQDVNAPTKIDSVLVEQIKRLGMIPFVQTNVPQSLLSYSCSNPVYGTTSHPLDKERTPGGSSGGESAIIAVGGSPIGIGGDVGGSIRIPCHFTGIAGIKPSHLRFSHRGVCGSVPGRPLINSNDGPMSVDIETTVDFLKEVWRDDWTHMKDPYVPPVLWDESQYKEGRTYRIGYYVDDGWFTPIPALQRAVLEARQLLEAAGHTLIPFHPPDIPRMMRHFVRAVCVDGGQYLTTKLFNDIIDSTLYGQIALFMIPLRLQRWLARPVELIFPRLANMMRSMPLNTCELREAYAEIEDYRSDFVMKMQEKELDALLCPPQVMTAPKHNVPSRLFAACSYTAVFNLLDFGADVTAEDDRKLQEEYSEADPWYRLVKESCKGCIGYPVNVQVAAPPYREETALRILRDIEVAVKDARVTT